MPNLLNLPEALIAPLPHANDASAQVVVLEKKQSKYAPSGHSGRCCSSGAHGDVAGGVEQLPREGLQRPVVVLETRRAQVGATGVLVVLAHARLCQIPVLSIPRCSGRGAFASAFSGRPER
jgi:hypothetical protein